MANAFFIEPANPLAALMQGVGGYDRAVQNRRQNEQEEARNVLGRIMQSGNINYNQVAGSLAQLGQYGPALQAIQQGQDEGLYRDLQRIQGGGPQLPAARAQPPPGFAPPAQNAQRMSYGAGEFNPLDAQAGQPAPQQAGAPLRVTVGPGGQPGPGAGMASSGYGSAISSIESGGNYNATGPQTRTGDRAYGKYQVMGANIGPWTREVLGHEYTPQEFLADPQAQEAVFRAKFGEYVQRFGNPQDAASAWFTGRPLSQGANRRDVNGVTGQQYVDRFNAALSGQPQQAGQPQQSQGQGEDPRLAQLTALLARARTPQQAAAIQAYINRIQPDLQIMSQPDGTILAINKRTMQTNVIHQGARPTWGVIRENSDGTKEYGFIDPTTSRVTQSPLGPPSPPANPYASPGRAPTESQSKDRLYTARMMDAELILSNPAVVSAAQSSWQQMGGAIGNRVPFGFGRGIMTTEFQQYDQAQRNFINAVLRRESGAVISDAEFENARKQYFPQPNDDALAVAQKAQHRRRVIEEFAGGAGQDWRPPFVFNAQGQLVPNRSGQQQRPIQPPQQRRPPNDRDIAALRSNPQLRSDFDAKFGAGAAEQVLGGA